MKYNFDQRIERRGTNSVKYDDLSAHFGRTDLLPMWVADMDFQTAPPIQEAALECCRRGVFGYTFRSERAKEAYMDWVGKRYDWQVLPEWLSISPGIVTALAVSIRAFTRMGEKVLVLTPVYPPFLTVPGDNGRELVCSSLVIRNGRYEVDWEDFEHKLGQGVRLFILSNSHNPVGRVWSREELKRMGELCCRYDVLILSDEIHADLSLFGHRHTVMASVSGEIADRTLTAMAPSKTFNIAGMMNSVIVASSERLRDKYNREMLALHLDLGNILGHVTFEAAYRYGGEWLEELLIYLGENVNFADDFIKHNLPGVRMIKPEGSFLLWLDFRETGLSHEETGRILVEKARVGLNDGQSFGKEGIGFRRMNIGCPREVLAEGLDRIAEAFGNR